MPRQLPWKVNTTTTKPKSTTATPRAASSTSTSRLTPHSRTATPGSTGTGPSKFRRSLTLDVTCTPPRPSPKTSPSLTPTARTPSPSRPPSPLPESQMHTPHDDRFRMVEDEFLATAQQFTRHLHQAEYQRLKAAAAARAEGDAEAIRRGEVREERVVVRPMVGASAGGRVEGRRREREGGGLRGLLSSPPRREMPLLVLGRGREGSPSRGEGRGRVFKEEEGGRTAVEEEVGGGDDVRRRRTGTEEGRKRRSEVPLREPERERGKPARSTSPLPWVPPDDDDDFLFRMRAQREEKRRKRESGVKRAESPTVSLDDIPFI